MVIETIDTIWYNDIMVDLELPSFDFDLDIGGGIEFDMPSLDLDLGGDIGGVDLAPAGDLGGTSFETGIGAPLGVSYDVTGELDSGLVDSINRIGAFVLAETAAEPALGLNSEPGLLSLAPAAETMAVPEYLPAMPDALPVVSPAAAASTELLPAVPDETFSSFIDSLNETVLPAIEEQAASDTPLEPVLLYAEQTLPDAPEAEAQSQLVFSSLLSSRNMSLEDTAVSITHGQQAGEPFTDTTRFATTTTGLVLIHNERVFPQAGTAASEVIATDTSVASYLEKLRPIQEKPPVLNVGWSDERGDYALTWREGEGSREFPKDVELNLRGEFSGPTWKAIPKPSNPILLKDTYAEKSQPQDYRVLEGVHAALNGLRDYITQPIVTTIPE